MSKNNPAKQKKTLLLAENAMLTAIIVLMAFTPLGYLQVGVVKMTLIMIPVAVGAITLGPLSGAFLGLVFGVTSFAQCFGLDAFGTTLMSINPFYTFIMCMVPRMLMGYLCGVIFKAVGRFNKSVGYAVASLSSAVLNTLLFMTALLVFFGGSDYIAGIRAGRSIFQFFVFFVGLNGLLEILATALIGAPVAAAVDKGIKSLK